MKKNKQKNKPVIIKGESFGEMLDKLHNAPPPKPKTPEQQAKINDLIKQLIESQEPGDALLMFGVPPKKEN